VTHRTPPRNWMPNSRKTVGRADAQIARARCGCILRWTPRSSGGAVIRAGDLVVGRLPATGSSAWRSSFRHSDEFRGLNDMAIKATENQRPHQGSRHRGLQGRNRRPQRRASCR